MRSISFQATSLFVLYIGQSAMEFATKNKRKTVKESDLIEALKDAEFEDLIPLLEKEMALAKEKKAKDLISNPAFSFTCF